MYRKAGVWWAVLSLMEHHPQHSNPEPQCFYYVQHDKEGLASHEGGSRRAVSSYSHMEGGSCHCVFLHRRSTSAYGSEKGFAIASEPRPEEDFSVPMGLMHWMHLTWLCPHVQHSFTQAFTHSLYVHSGFSWLPTINYIFKLSISDYMYGCIITLLPKYLDFFLNIYQFLIR